MEVVEWMFELEGSLTEMVVVKGIYSCEAGMFTVEECGGSC